MNLWVKETDSMDTKSSKMIAALDFLYKKALNGRNRNDTVQKMVGEVLKKYPNNPQKACKEFIKDQAIKCGATGFVTGLAGIITIPLAVTADIGVTWYIQLRMIMAIAAIYGFDIHSDKVKTFVYICLAGQAPTNILKDVGVKIGTKLTKNAIQKISGHSLKKINQMIGFRFITKAGEKGVINMSKTIPFVGGIIGGVFDFTSTKVIAERAIRTFGEEISY